MPALDINPHDFASRVIDTWSAQVLQGRYPAQPHRYNYASAWTPCTRRMVLEMTQPEGRPPWSAEQLARFRRGDGRENDLIIDLKRVGRANEPPFKVIGEQQRFELRDHKSRVAIVGKVDGQIAIEGGPTVPVEVKAWSPFLVDRIERFADLFDNPWTRSGAHQLLAYLFAMGVPFGFLLLDRSGLPLLLPVELEPHLQQLEDFLARAERAIDHVEAGTLPDYLASNAAECKRCPFYGGTCNPPLSGEGGLRVISDPELEAALARRDALDAAATEYGRIDKDVKARLRGVESAVIGPFVIEGKWGKQARTDLPAALKAQYTTVDPKGRFTLEITRLS